MLNQTKISNSTTGAIGHAPSGQRPVALVVDTSLSRGPSVRARNGRRDRASAQTSSKTGASRRSPSGQSCDAPAVDPSLSGGHRKRARKGLCRSASAQTSLATGAGEYPPSGQVHVAPVVNPIERIQELQVRRKFFIKTVTKQANAVGALARRAIGFDASADEDVREAVNKRAARIVGALMSGKDQKPDDEPIALKLAADVAVVKDGMAPYEKTRADVEKTMRKAARELPAAAWAKGVHGLGELALAVIVGEAGDVGSYKSHDALWKRLGLAPMNGKAMSTWRTGGGLSAEEWTAAGYSPRRRAEIYACLGDPLFRQQSVVSGPYREAYDRRRAWTAFTHPEWTKGHSHNDAIRIMTKALIRDLYREWRRA